METYCIVITGLPASGKSTVGKYIAASLDIPFLDKDTYLETLFNEKGIGNTEWRRTLSQQSNHLFQEDAKSKPCVVLISHWRPINQTGHSGTPTEWLPNTYAKIIQVYCTCPIETATKRFKERTRHRGHLDHTRPIEEIREWMHQYAPHLPLNLGHLIQVDTTKKQNIKETVQSIQKVLSSQESKT